MRMHSCKNNTGGNISHLEQLVKSFLPYSQQQLGFDKPVKIIFQSDPSNADVLLGKTAQYNPQEFEVHLYTDRRHPKDIMRSLSHEMVHHAQNCRGDFGSCGDTSAGYAQRDPHLRKMEREAYTKGNLIFRDFEDLIKTGKITIDINFKDSGEPQMSLKEWKDNELNTLLMKKWGLGKNKTRLDEGVWTQGGRDEIKNDPGIKAVKGAAAGALGGVLGIPGRVEDGEEEEDEEGNRPSMAKDMDLDEEAGHPGRGCDEAHPDNTGPAGHREFMSGGDGYVGRKGGDLGEEKNLAAKRRKALIDPGMFEEAAYRDDELEDSSDELEEGDPLMKLTPKGHRDTETSSDRRLAYEKDPAGHMTTDQALELGLSPDTVRSAVDWDPTAEHPDDRRDMRQHSRGGHAVGLGTARRRWRKAFAGQFKEGQISVKEAKQITRRIIERIRKEGK
jgi:hypothetical protein